MQDLFTLGEHYVSDFVKVGQESRAGKHELSLVLDDNGCVRLKHIIPVDKLFGKYFYRSSRNFTMRKELKNVVDSVMDVFSFKPGDIWIDLASNDGTLLSYLPTDLIKIGIDPAEDSYKNEAEKYADLIIQDFFSANVFKKSKFGNKKAKVITGCAFFYDIEHPDLFLQDILKILEDDGLFVLQLSYTPTMLKGLQFDNCVAEHVFYYSFFNLKRLLETNGFKILDCTLNNCNGGSFRVFAMKKHGNEKLFANQSFRDIAEVRIESLLQYEQSLKLDQVETWKIFFRQVEELKEKTVSFIRNARKEGKTVWGLGASTKGNTLLGYFGLTNQDLDAIAERDSNKVGLMTVGTNIPIKSEDDFRKTQPDYALILIWPFITELQEREAEYLRNGGQFLVPCPRFEIISTL